LVYVNGKPVTEYFSRTKDVENVLWPLQSLSVLGQFNVWVSTFGGGTTGIIHLIFVFSFVFCVLELTIQGNRRQLRLLLHGRCWRMTNLVS